MKKELWKKDNEEAGEQGSSQTPLKKKKAKKLDPDAAIAELKKAFVDIRDDLDFWVLAADDNDVEQRIFVNTLWSND